MQYLNASLRHWLKLQCQSLGNVKAALLVKLTQTRPEVVAKWPDASAKNQALLSALKPLREKQRLHLATMESGDLVLAHPLIVDGKFWGGLVLEVAASDKKKVPEILKSLQAGQVWLQLLLHQQPELHKEETNNGIKPNRSVTDSEEVNNNTQVPVELLPAGSADALLALNIQLLKENSWQEMAISLVNRLATELKATRVSLALLDKKELVLEAVSFSASFDRRTDSMRALVEAMQEAVEQGRPITYPTSVTVTDPTPGVIAQAHHQLLHRQQVREVQTCLLRKGSQTLGAVTLEFNEPRSSDSKVITEQQQFLTQALSLATSLLALRIQAEAGMRQTLARGAGRLYGRWFGQSIWRSRIIGGLAVILLMVLWIPADYSISGDASLQSLEKHLVVSPQDAYLGAINARPGDQVTQGQLLAQLKDDDLRLERRKLMSQVQQYRQAYDAALANANRVEAAIANAQTEQADIQLRLIEQQLERTRLSAPVDGLVVSDDIAQRLGAPVKQGEILFEIASRLGFLVQLSIDERDIALVSPGQEGHIKLASLPGEVFAFRIKSITPLSEVHEGRNYFRVEAELVGDSTALRPGMSGTGKIFAGQRSLGWIWFHDLWHWLRLSFW